LENRLVVLVFGYSSSQTIPGHLLAQSEPIGTGTRLMMSKVYVGNLADSVTSSDLKVHFQRAGEVLGALAITDRESGLCRGFGFVEMAEVEDAALAYSLLNNTLLNGRLIRIEPEPPAKKGKVRNRTARS
jgi:cold-inducible RNA-binding protein